MDIQKLTAFFKWCTIINLALLILWTAIFMLIPDLVYATQSFFFPFSREAFDVIFYALLAAYKILWLIFNLVPWVALLIVGKK